MIELSESKKKRGRDQLHYPYMVAGWRYATGASIAEAAKKFRISSATVKRYCAAQSEEDALRARYSWFFDRWELTTTNLGRMLRSEGYSLTVARKLNWRIKHLEARGREVEEALEERGLDHLGIFQPPKVEPEVEARRAERDRWLRIIDADPNELDDYEAEYGFEENRHWQDGFDRRCAQNGW